MVDRIRCPTVSYLPFYYVFFQFLLLTIFNLQANILTTKDILSNLAPSHASNEYGTAVLFTKKLFIVVRFTIVNAMMFTLLIYMMFTLLIIYIATREP